MSNNKFFNALCNAGGDAFLVETEEAAEWLNNEVENRETSEVLPDDGDFADICARLELSADNNVKRVFRAANYNQEPIYYALAGDWALA